MPRSAVKLAARHCAQQGRAKKRPSVGPSLNARHCAERMSAEGQRKLKDRFGDMPSLRLLAHVCGCGRKSLKLGQSVGSTLNYLDFE